MAPGAQPSDHGAVAGGEELLDLDRSLPFDRFGACSADACRELKRPIDDLQVSAGSRRSPTTSPPRLRRSQPDELDQLVEDLEPLAAVLGAAGSQ